MILLTVSQVSNIKYEPRWLVDEIREILRLHDWYDRFLYDEYDFEHLNEC